MPYDIELLNQAVAGGQQQFQAFRTLYVMLGGTGMKIGMRLRKRIVEAYGVAQLPFQEFLWLDTDRRDLKSQCVEDPPEIANRRELPADDIVDLTLPFERVRNFRDNPHNAPWLQQWLSPDLLADLKDSARAEEGAAQIRALGRLAFEANFADFRSAVERKRTRLLRPTIAADSNKFRFQVDGGPVEVVVLCSLAGGTGSGCFIQVARCIRHLMAAGGGANTTAYLLMPGVFNERLGGPLSVEDANANAFAALAELNALSAFTAVGFRPEPLWIDGFRPANPGGDPFNQIYLVDSMNEQNTTFDRPPDEDAYAMIADALYFDFEQSAFGTAKRSHRCNVGPHLANTTVLSVPIEDGTNWGEAQPRYIFRFPNAFGAFGLARVPFERRRLRRSASAWLAQRMFGVLVGQPAHRLGRDDVVAQVVLPQIEAAGLTASKVIGRLLTDGRLGQPFYEAAGDEIAKKLGALRQSASDHFDPPGMTEGQRLKALRDTESFGRELESKARAVFNEARQTVLGLLSGTGAREAWGAHLKSIIQAQDNIFADYREALRQFILNLLAQPRSHGCKVAEIACEVLRDELRQVLRAPDEEPSSANFASLGVDPGKEIQRAVDMRANAEALFLPVYKQIARRYYRRRNRNLLKGASGKCSRDASEYLAGVEATFKAWCKAEYEVVARKHCKQLFQQLSDFIGDQIEVKGEGREASVRTTGLHTELRQFREAADHAQQYFSSLQGFYAGRRHSGRDAEDTAPTGGMERAIEDALAGADVVDRQPLEDMLLDEWRKFFADAQILTAGQGDSFLLGVDALRGRAMARQTNQQGWREVEEKMEAWTVTRLDHLGFLDAHDAITCLAATGDAHAQSQLNHVGRGAAPWTGFDPGRGIPPALQRIALLGTEHVNAPVVQAWANQQAGALAGVQTIDSQSGSVVLYAEKMAFPLFFVAALDELEQCYHAVVDRDPFQVLRRHTVANYLDLPVIRPPRDPAQANEWFLLDRLALEAILLNTFDEGLGGTVHYTFFDANNVRNNFKVPGSLSAIAAKLRNEPVLEDAIRAAVEERTQRLLCDRTAMLQALALAFWTQNDAFPLHQQFSYLEHELAASIVRCWREAAEHHLELEPQTHVEEARDLGAVERWAPASPVSARALAAGVAHLRCLPRELWNQASGGSQTPLLG